MSRWVLVVLVAAVSGLYAQDSKPQEELKKEHPKASAPDKKAPQAQQEEVPPEEDTSVAPPVFSFNPLQSKKDVITGNFYFKKKSYIAAAGRFRDATKWDDSNSEAWLRLGEAEEKLKDHHAARDAYKKYLELAGDAKNADEIRKRMNKLK
jgi:predicted Zn-dependent protease